MNRQVRRRLPVRSSEPPEPESLPHLYIPVLEWFFLDFSFGSWARAARDWKKPQTLSPFSVPAPVQGWRTARVPHELTFDELQTQFQRYKAGSISDEYVLQTWGEATLELMQAQLMVETAETVMVKPDATLRQE